MIGFITLSNKYYYLKNNRGVTSALSISISIVPISSRVDRASATKAVNSGSIPGRVKPKTIKIDIHSFPA